MAVARGKIVFGGLQMSEQLISRRGAFSLLGLGAALGFAVPTTLLTESDAEAQMQPNRSSTMRSGTDRSTDVRYATGSRTDPSAEAS
jgi:hypothetical protein